MRRLARNATTAKPVFFDDEMDVHLNPKIGRDRALKGQRRYVRPPGQNRKQFVAGALNALTGWLTRAAALNKASDLFRALVWKFVGEYRDVRRIHIILNNYIIHASKRTKHFLARFGDRLVLHFLPPYCPDDNRIGRVWLDLHANVTCSHRRPTIEELMFQVVAFIRAYNQRKKLNPSLKFAVSISGSRSVV